MATSKLVSDDVPGRKALSVTCGDSSPKGRPRHRILAQEMERICIDTLHRFTATPQCACRPKVGIKRFPSAPLASPCGKVAPSARKEANNISQRPIGKCWHLRRQMTSRGRKALSVTCGDSSPKGEPRHRILAQEMERICIDTLHSLFTATPQCACRPKVGWS